MKTYMLVWILADCGTPQNLVKVCHDYKIDGVVVKLLDGSVRYNVPQGDPGLRAYIDACRNADPPIEFHGWSYQYITQPGLQGDCIMERCEKFDIDYWHLNVEKEFKAPGAGDAFIKIAEKLQERGFEVLVCSYRYPDDHTSVPWLRMNNRPEVDGWSPQVYWALAHNPVEQLNKSVAQYNLISDKPYYAMGPLFGQGFAVKQSDGTTKDVYWEPKPAELTAFRNRCKALMMPKIYWFRLDWAIKRGRWDLLAPACGVGVAPEPPEPPVDPELPNHVVIKGLDDEDNETLNMRRSPGGKILAMTWNGSDFYPTDQGVDSQGRRWFKVGSELWIASWYTEAIP